MLKTVQAASGGGGGNGTVTQVSTGTGLTGGPITTTGTVSLANTTVTAGSYGNSTTVATFTVNSQGQLTAASNATIANITLGNAALSVGGTTTTVGNLTLQNANITSVAATFPNSYLSNSTTTLGNATLTLGNTTTSVGNVNISGSRVDPRANAQSNVASITPNIAVYDQYAVSGQAQALTINAPTGTPVDGNKLILRLLDNGVSQTVSWNATYTVIGTTLPTTTTAGKMVYIGCIYNSANTRWDVVAVTTQA